MYYPICHYTRYGYDWVFIRGYERQVGFKFNFNMNVVEKPAIHATSVKEFFENCGNISPASIKSLFFYTKLLNQICFMIFKEKLRM